LVDTVEQIAPLRGGCRHDVRGAPEGDLVDIDQRERGSVDSRHTSERPAVDPTLLEVVDVPLDEARHLGHAQQALVG